MVYIRVKKDNKAVYVCVMTGLTGTTPIPKERKKKKDVVFWTEDEGAEFSALGPKDDEVHILVSMELASYTSWETQSLLHILKQHMLSSRCLFQREAFTFHEVYSKLYTAYLLQQHD